MPPAGADFAAASELLAMSRFYQALHPEMAETRWRRYLEFAAIPSEHQAPGHCYRFASGPGFIMVDKDANGQWVRELPVGVDPASTIVVPALTSAPRWIDEMRRVVRAQSRAARERLKPFIDNLEKLTAEGHDAAAVKAFALPAFAALMAGIDQLVAYLGQCVPQYADRKLLEGTTYGGEIGAVKLIDALAKAVAGPDAAGNAPTPAMQAKLFGMLLAPGGQALEHLAARFVRDAVAMGLENRVLGTLDGMRRDGRATLNDLRDNLLVVGGHPEMTLINYYNGLMLILPTLRAAMLGFQVVAEAPQTSAAGRPRAKIEANAAEEIVVRLTDALFFAARDRAGTETRNNIAEIQALMARGQEKEAAARATRLIDLQYFYPRPYRPVLFGSRTP